MASGNNSTSAPIGRGRGRGRRPTTEQQAALQAMTWSQRAARSQSASSQQGANSSQQGANSSQQGTNSSQQGANRQEAADATRPRRLSEILNSQEAADATRRLSDALQEAADACQEEIDRIDRDPPRGRYFPRIPLRPRNPRWFCSCPDCNFTFG